ncbi:MAG: NADH dehydrogenase [Candidatus Nitrosocaldaceae archaeon]|nr:MAG: NADH dehydrogenase [Candidatus Nitrosocaldaceae archaeon]
MYSFFDVIENRHSIRAYKDREVEEEKLLKILEVVRKAPSAGNLQAYMLYVVKSKSIKKRLAEAALNQEFIAEAPIVLVFVAVPERSTWRYGSRGEFYALQDATIAAAYAQLAATALELASVWVGAFDDEEVKDIIDTKDKPIAIMPIGYPNEEPEITERRKIEEFVIYK